MISLILVGSFLLKLHNIDHLALKGLNESFHAIVAQHLLDHPIENVFLEIRQCLRGLACSYQEPEASLRCAVASGRVVAAA